MTDGESVSDEKTRSAGDREGTAQSEGAVESAASVALGATERTGKPDCKKKVDLGGGLSEWEQTAKHCRP